MNMWKQVELRDICDAIIDCVNKTAPLSNYETPYKMLRTPDIRDGFINTENLRCVDEEIFKKWTRRGKLQKGDVILTREAPVGEVGFIKDPENLFLGQRLVLYRTNPQKCNSLFLLYSFLFKENKLAILGQGNGSTVTHLKIPDCEKIKIKLPPLETQDKIASVLSAYDNLIENNNKRIKILEQMAENLYKEWFVRFRFPGHETTPIENGIPQGWRIEKLSSIFEVKYGKDHKNIEDGTIPIFGSGGIMRYGNKALYSDESVLIPRKGSLNNVMYYSDDFWTVDTMFYTKMKISHFAKYAYFTLSKVDFEGLNSGASIPSMTTDILYHLKMVVPDQNTLIAFDKQIETLFSEKQLLQKNNDNLTKQRDLLLPRLMSGKLAV